MLDSISEQLLACQSALNQYIDDKRSIFPRLYFLSDDDLLELLGQARAGADGREAVMQTHLKKLYPGTTGVRLGPGNMSITAMCSHHGETFQLEHPVDIDCAVEVWLKNLETEMRSSLRNLTLKCVVSSTLQEQDPFTLPTQIICLAQNIRFTEQAEKAISSRDLHKLKAAIEKENLNYVSADVEDESERNKRQALILQCAHYMSVIRILIEKNVTTINDWLWQKQLRFYFTSSKDVVAKMGLAQISYSYEYLGVNTGQFVRTELADECFLILTQALHLGLVGNPFGPAGTGKTESVKALGGLVGRLVLIFNCDEAVDAACMGRLLTGLALCGAWGCFDEFNRLTADTLAAVSHQFGSLLAAMQRKPSGAATALLNGKPVTVSEWCGIAATMNPAGRGYGGRRALPAALERVLRPIAMVQPRGDHLASHLLAARCILNADLLAADLQNVFTMASSLLSAQRHYDWGLRALKAAVGSCGVALQARAAHPLESQRAVTRRVLALNNMSKLTRHDAARFESILSLVFSDVPVEEPSSDPITKAIEAASDSLKYTRNKLQVQKCVELYEQLQQRMGVVIVGPPGSGKTAIRRILKNALTQQGRNIVEYTICPKAMCRDWLLGCIDADTRQWTDGVVSATALDVSNQSSDVWSWVVMDGDIDPEWVEALNSVLDDNRLLTLPSGWRVQFGPNVNFVFETHGLECASPATVSRMAVILLGEDVSCDMDFLSSWMQRADIENEIAKSALPLLHQVIVKCIQWFSSHKNDLVLKLNNLTLVKQILAQFEYIAQNQNMNSARISPEDIVYDAVERSIVDIVKDSAIAGLREELSFLGPPGASHSGPGEWVSDTLFMSPRLAACEPIVRACVTSDRSHLLIVGPDACAKNLLAEYITKECNSTIIAIDCTPVLEPAGIITELKRNNVVRAGGHSSSGNCARVTLLVRALHRARVDAWGSGAVHSFLLQLIEYGGFWSVGGGGEGEGGGAVWSRAAPLCVLATADGVPAAAPRLTAALAQYALNEPDDDEVSELVTVWLKQNADKNIQLKDITTLASTILAMYKEVTDTFRSRLHYKWNASHLRRWCENVKWYSPTNLEELIMAIAAEANMLFRDRLVTNEERTRFNKIARSYLKVDNDGLYFTCKLKGDGVYMEPVDYGAWHQSTEKLINQCLSEYEHSVFGESGAEACSELAVLCPATARACNGGMLVCVGSVGAGRRAAALLAAAALPASLHTVYHLSQFNAHFKSALASAAEGTRSLVFVGESAATDASLATIEALRSAQSPHSIPSVILPSVQNHHIMDNIKQNLGIIICLDKQQSNLSELMEKYPILYNDGHFVWLDRWSDNTLRDMPALVIQRLLKENVTEMTKEQMDAIPTEGFVKIHNSLSLESMKAPCRYVNFIQSYYNIVNRKRAALVQRQTMLSAGVEALRKARSEVAVLQANATEQETLLSEKQAKANSALDQISATVRANTDKKEEMHALKVNIERENENLQVQKKEIEAELASVEPVIAAARSAVGDLRPESLSEVRSLRAPPDVVRDVLEGVLRLMGIADTSWHSMKNFLSKRGVKEDIRCLDASQISPAALQSVQRLLEKRGASFEASTAKRASAACAPLAAWVRANVEYACALQRVQPLQAHQARLHTNLQEAEDQLSALSSGLASVDQRVGALKEQLGQHTRDAAAIEMRMDAAANTLRAARSLLHQLADENTAWESDLENIVREISELNQRSLLAAAYIVYLPDLTEPQAREYVKMWGKFIGFEDASFSVINFLSTTDKQLKWDAEGLSSDQSAVKNAVLIDQVLQVPKCGFTPLLIDPDGEGLVWLRNALSDVPSDFVSQHSDKLHTAVQYAVRLGRILVITDVDGVHDSWATVASGAGGRGGSAPAPARLVLHCRDATLARRLPPHVHASLATVHFTPRIDGLTDQLIHYALQHQNPEISGKSKEIKMQKAKLQIQQHELQENLLRDLSSNSDILHDANLLASLNRTRETNATISEALKVAREVERANSDACAKYQPSAKRAAALALAVKTLSARWPLVVMPVESVLETFVEAVRKSDSTNINNEEIVKYLTRRIVERVLLALHKKDKYVVVLYLLKQVYEELMPDQLWEYLIGRSEITDDAIDVTDIKKKHSWIPEERLTALAKLKLTDEDFYNRLSLQNLETWNQFISSGEINVLGKLKLSPFETVVGVAALRPDSLYRAIAAFVDHVLGTGAVFSNSPVQSAARFARRRPILLLAAHAADVLAAHAADNALIHVDVEQGLSAWQAGVTSARAGGWLVLSVAASPFTRDLQSFITELAHSNDNHNEDFRVWILSEYREIPPLVSNACVNVILEAPEGVKNNIMGTLSAWGNYEADPKMVRLHACLAVFHALVQERRAYIPQGWSRWYSWEWGEVCACVGAIRLGGAGAALCLPLYGARVQDSQDARLLAVLHARCLATATLPTLPVALPTASSLQAYASAFSGLPDIDTPQLLGLPANCRVAWEKNAATNIITVLKELNSTVSIHEKGDGVASLKTLLSLWKKNMSGCSLLKGGVGVGGRGAGWWGCVVDGEAEVAAQGARAVHAGLGQLARSLAHSQSHALLQVPEEWQLIWAGPSEPHAYVREFSHRARAAAARLDSLSDDGYMPTEVDLRSLLQPSRCVWALRAHTLERTRVRTAPHNLTLVGTWTQNAAADSMVVVGLAARGCCVVDGCLAPAPPAAPPHAPAPPLALRYLPRSEELPGVGTMEVPVYSNEARETLLFSVRLALASGFPPDVAQLHAAALFVPPLH